MFAFRHENIRGREREKRKRRKRRKRRESLKGEKEKRKERRKRDEESPGGPEPQVAGPDSPCVAAEVAAAVGRPRRR